MSITLNNPASGTTITPHEAFNLTISHDTATEVLLSVTDGETTENIWTLTGGFQTGYDGTVLTLNGVSFLSNVSRAAGWFDASLSFTVTETYGAGPVSATFTYLVSGFGDYPEGTRPYSDEGVSPGGGGGGVSDHGDLLGLADDDHVQYHTDARGDARYYTQSQVDAAIGTVEFQPSIGTWAYDSTSTVGAGITTANFRVNNGSFPIATEIYIAYVNAEGRTTTTLWPTIVGSVINFKKTGTDFWFRILGLTNSGSYATLAVDYIGGGGAGLSNGDALALSCAGGVVTLSGSGPPGVSTGDGAPLGAVYVDTAADEAYVLVDRTPGANVWHQGGGGGSATAIGDLSDVTIGINGIQDGDFLVGVNGVFINGQPSFGDMRSIDNLSSLTNVAAARDNLALGTVAVLDVGNQDAGDVPF
jgi:hypothetical protein